MLAIGAFPASKEVENEDDDETIGGVPYTALNTYERALESGAPYRIEIIGARLFILAPLSGQIFAWPTPRVETYKR